MPVDSLENVTKRVQLKVLVKSNKKKEINNKKDITDKKAWKK